MANNGNIVINASDVNLDLNNRTVTGTIIIAANMSGVSISNGTINANGAASGILVNSGASNVSISNVTVKNATTGIDLCLRMMPRCKAAHSHKTLTVCSLIIHTT